jgi:hypothetical protein
MTKRPCQRDQQRSREHARSVELQSVGGSAGPELHPLVPVDEFAHGGVDQGKAARNPQATEKVAPIP